ncbi:MAG: redoxin domain-containing protein [Planctomycetaceae bacterium]|nr:redoxin domain-containing protein [Planctomycetaceae bacterium]
MRLVTLVLISILISKSLSADDAIRFSLQDYRGRAWNMSDFDEKPVVVLAFLGTECPLVKVYGLKLNEIAARYADQGVVLVGVNSNRHDSVTEIAAFARRQNLDFPILKDVNNALADAVSAERTPEVVVLDQQRQVRYRGRIDDQHGVGFTRPEPTENNLIDAIDAVLQKQSVKVPHAPAEGCLIGRVREVNADSKYTYAEHVAPILNRHCVECHRADEIAPFALTSYEEAAGWSDMIREVTRDQRMPPWHADPAFGHFENARGLTEQEKQILHQWALDGAPAGDLDAAPPVPEKHVSEWHLDEEPDQIVSMGETFVVPASGEVKYKYFEVDPGFKEDRWIRAAEIHPGNRAVVHHILVFAKPPGESRGMPGAGGGSFLSGYVPGSIPRALPPGMAKFVPAGSKLTFQMHYTPIGTEQTDKSSIGLYFADDEDVDQIVMTQEVINSKFTIPAEADNWEVTAESRKSPLDVKLLSLMPHMHLRGKSFRYVVVPPDQTEPDLENGTVLNVPEYDFNWQTAYRLREPLSFPAGSRMYCVAHFDNSAANLNNPAPSAVVRWGDQTWDEMMIGYFDVAFARNDSTIGAIGKTRGSRGTAAGDGGQGNRAQLAELLRKYDTNKDGQFQRSEIPEQLLPAFRKLDTDNNEVLDVEELRAFARQRREEK